jgi:hypothetical protein
MSIHTYSSLKQLQEESNRNRTGTSRTQPSRTVHLSYRANVYPHITYSSLKTNFYKKNDVLFYHNCKVTLTDNRGGRKCYSVVARHGATTRESNIQREEKVVTMTSPTFHLPKKVWRTAAPPRCSEVTINNSKMTRRMTAAPHHLRSRFLV